MIRKKSKTGPAYIGAIVIGAIAAVGVGLAAGLRKLRKKKTEETDRKEED